MNKVIGKCKCPLPWCGEADAEVREGEKGAPYIVCESCVSMVRSQSRAGKNGMRQLAGPAPAPAAKPADKPAAKPEPAPAARKRGGVAALLGMTDD